eukprot:TRINITY_DN1295_c0_g2_i4.p1 TRINITY_DN1295_c0_g2~~TRINITY_DN1295_c0_g2_i4.p1  ORF type:complete len:534 (+),score=100.14 TRINITY_DN1295_c0_g2_i4:156-1604(+)
MPIACSKHSSFYSTTPVSASLHTTPVTGMLTLDQLRKKAQEGSIETVVMGFTDLVGRLSGKRYDVDFFLSDGIKGTHACSYLMTIDIEQKVLDGFEFSNWQTGFGDFILVPDMSTLRVATWLEKSAFVVCSLQDKEGNSVPIGPRNVLARQMERLASLGYKANGASELEYYMYKNSYEEVHNNNYEERSLSPFGYFLGDYNLLQSSREEPFTAQMRRHLKGSGVPVENSKGEAGLGQHELNVKYSDPLTMSDRHTVFKQCFKEVAQQQGIAVTFMAKPHTHQAGSSCHIHISLTHPDGKNAFRGDEEFCGVKCSPLFKHFLAGLLKHTGELMVFLAPTINSYKRFQSNSWAPTKLAWSVDNRTAGFRVLPEGEGFRIECRIGGADCNVYLAFSAILAAGIDGIEQKLECPPALKGDLYTTKGIPQCPSTLQAALEAFERSDFAKKAFGVDVVKHYSHYYREEVRQFNDYVTNWERRRYFEQI